MMNTTMSEIHTNHIEMRKDNTMSVQKKCGKLQKQRCPLEMKCPRAKANSQGVKDQGVELQSPCEPDKVLQIHQQLAPRLRTDPLSH